ncbi:DUF6314 family protein [Yoonia sp. BS5-3]|uniref:DUF6314 family protein n=1 Tax=Yoonia phaeophyticola TaxID=3137369 RepID=A0ABZ2V6T3_9RHOB
MKLASLPQNMADFEGKWVLDRQIADARAGQNGHLTGHAVFTRRSESVLEYCEEGRLQMGQGPALQATRRYIWHFDAGQVAVQFDDEAPFHRFALTPTAVGEDHLCGDDLYRSTYDFADWPKWECRWSVVGPRKDYVSTTRYRR